MKTSLPINRSFVLVLILSLVSSTLAMGFQPAPQAAAPGFAYRCGIHFCIDGQPFYFAGANTYDVFTFGDGSSSASQSDIETRYMDKARIDAHFARLQADKVTVLRLWMFSHETWHGFEIQKGVYNEAEFMLFDYIIESAKAHNVMLIPVFENYWEAYGGIDTRLGWEGLTGTERAVSLLVAEGGPGLQPNMQDRFGYLQALRADLAALLPEGPRMARNSWNAGTRSGASVLA